MHDGLSKEHRYPARRARAGCPHDRERPQRYERDGSFSTSKETHWQSFDAGLAAEAFCVAAHDAGLGTVILGIYDEGKVKAVLNLPETESVSALIPIGVPAESPAAPKRKDVSELLRIR